MVEPSRTDSSIGFVVALGSAIATVLIMAHTSSDAPLSGGRVGFYAWVASPFIALCGLNLYCLRVPVSHAFRRAVAITTGAISLSVFLYADAVFSPRSSTAALIFIFLPAWSLAGGAALLFLSFVVLLNRTG